MNVASGLRSHRSPVNSVTRRVIDLDTYERSLGGVSIVDIAKK